MLQRLRAKFMRRTRYQTLSSLDAYALWAQHYPAKAHNALMELEQRTMLAMLPDVRGQSVLDLACGTGRYGLLAAAHGATRVYSIDNSLAMLRVGQLERPAQATMTRLPLPNAQLDTVLCGLALGHLPRIDDALHEVARVLRTGGQALISDFHPFQALRGAQRTFTAPDGRTFAVVHHVHLLADYHAACTQAGLHIEQIAEPRWQGSPVVLVLRLHKVN